MIPYSNEAFLSSTVHRGFLLWVSVLSVVERKISMIKQDKDHLNIDDNIVGDITQWRWRIHIATPPNGIMTSPASCMCLNVAFCFFSIAIYFVITLVGFLDDDR